MTTQIRPHEFCSRGPGNDPALCTFTDYDLVCNLPRAAHDGDHPLSVSETELAQALAGMSLLELMGLSARTLASGIFHIIQRNRDGASRWVTGALYTSDWAIRPNVYLRELNGWWSYDSRERFRDGSIDTTGFQRLIPEDRPSRADRGSTQYQFGDH